MKFVLFLGLLFSLSSCYTSSMMQTAKTLDKGESEFTFGAGGLTSSGAFGITPDFMLRWGASDKSDFGLGYSLQLNGHIRADWKRELWSSPDETQFLSSGAMFEAFFPNEFEGSPSHIGVCVPLYYSFNHNKKWVPYFGQRFSVGVVGLDLYNYSDINDPLQERVDLNHSMYYSGAAGVQFGEGRFKWFLEASYSFRFGRRFYNYFNVSDEAWRLFKGYDEDANFQVTLGLNLRRK